MVERRDEHAGSDADTLFHVVVVSTRAVTVDGVALLEHDHEPRGDLDELIVVIGAEPGECLLPLVVHSVFDVVGPLLGLGGEANLVLDVTIVGHDELPRLPMRA